MRCFRSQKICIRKDLKILENVGKLKRTYGGAILSQDYPLKRDVVDRRQFNLDKKRTIAAKAFKLIKNNETIFLVFLPQILNWQSFLLRQICVW